jgi:protein-S-isoprenylcysteine O-methyltransferase Ste14
MTDNIRVPLAIRVPPPLLFAATFVMGMGLQHLAPINIGSDLLVRVGHLIGFGLLGCGVLLALACVGLFLTARTTLIPFGTASNLVTRGPYRFTRNPMYLSLLLVYLGVVGLLGQPWPLFLLPLPVALVNTIVIPFEEARLRHIFGDAFGDYCANVRRWL